MSKPSAELFAERQKRVKDAIELKVPDRVPFSPLFNFFPAHYANISCREFMYDYDKLAMALKRVHLDLQPDTYSDTFRSFALGPVLEALDYKQLKWPGHDLTDDVTYQFVEGEYITAEEYDAFLFDPSDFILRIFYPRVFGALTPLKMLPYLPMSYSYTRVLPLMASLASPEFDAAYTSTVRAVNEALKAMKKALELGQEMEALGFPRQFGSAALSPFDYIGDFFRGTKGIMLDMYRNPDKLLEVLEKVTQIMIKGSLSVPKIPGVHRVFIPLHKGLDGFMSQEQFKTFFWPSLKKLMMVLIDAGFVPNPLWEGDCTSRLEIIADMPRGKCVYWFERTDVIRAKEILNNHICIEAGVPSSLLITGSSQEVEEYCKKLIDVIGRGGGFIFNGDVGIPDEAKVENVRTMAKFVQEYGVYS
jgi:hypothetical protein